VTFGTDRLGYLGCQRTIAAADVEDAFARLGVKVGDDSRGKLGYERSS